MHGNARILDIDTNEIERRFAETREVAVVPVPGAEPPQPHHHAWPRWIGHVRCRAGGRARADRCDIYTDVDGVYTTDPRVTDKARKLDRVSHEEMLEMASLGAKVLQTRSVSIAMSQGVPLQVLSSFEDKPGTLVTAEDESMEKDVVSGIAFSRDEARVTLIGIPDRPGVAAAIFGALGDAAINVDMIVQSRTVIDGDAKTDMTFTCGQSDLPRALALMEERHDDIQYTELESDEDVAKVSIVGVGMRTNPVWPRPCSARWRRRTSTSR